MNCPGGSSGGDLEFLSCLFGSEQQIQVAGCRDVFLSCLFGSEHVEQPCRRVRQFLSCLFGSEPRRRHEAGLRNFLSCLFGSERGSVRAQSTGTISELPIRQ